jgi:hypothetical protein
MPLQIGQSSGDYLESQRRLHVLYMGLRVTGQRYAPDAFTQVNPPIVSANVTTKLAGVFTRGVLGSSVAYTRPDAGNGAVGGPPTVFNGRARVLGLFIADAAGVAFENTPSIASGMASYYADGGTYASSLWETFNLDTGAPLVYTTGDELWGSKNGLITNVADDNNTYEQGALRTLVGIVKIAPEPANPFLVFCLRL